MTVDVTEVVRAVEELNALMISHGGALELESVSPDGVVTLRFAAICAGCLYRPATLAATVRPRLLAVPGVTDVVAPGTRISEQAAARMAAFGFGLRPPLKLISREEGSS